MRPKRDQNKPVTDIAALAAPGVRRLTPYAPGKPLSELEREYGVRDAVKLASNENPLGPSPRALTAAQAVLAGVNLYPDGGGFALKQALARRHDVAPNTITLGNGSNDILELLARAFVTPADEVVFSAHSFAVYPIVTQAVGATARVAPVHDGSRGPEYSCDLDALSACVNPKTRLIFLANPNNPTGSWLGADELESFVAALPAHVLVVVDEAYYEYACVIREGHPDCTPWVARYPNLIVTRTFSKIFGLAGLRIGYSVSQPAVADILNRVRQPFNVNSVAMAAAEAALADQEHVVQSAACNRDGLVQLAAGCERLRLGYIPSAGNFLCIDMGRPAAPVYEALLRRGVIVRPVANYALPNHLRITVGTRDQNDRVLNAMREALA